MEEIRHSQQVSAGAWGLGGLGGGAWGAFERGLRQGGGLGEGDLGVDQKPGVLP